MNVNLIQRTALETLNKIAASMCEDCKGAGCSKCQDPGCTADNMKADATGSASTTDKKKGGRPPKAKHEKTDFLGMLQGNEIDPIKTSAPAAGGTNVDTNANTTGPTVTSETKDSK